MALDPGVMSWAQNNGLSGGSESDPFNLGDYGQGSVIGNSGLYKGADESAEDFVTRLHGEANGPAWGTAGRSFSDLQNSGLFNTLSPVDVGGQQMHRVGDQWNPERFGPKAAALFKQLNTQATPNDQYGSLIPEEDYQQYSKAAEQDNKGGLGDNPLALIAAMAAMAGGAGFLAGGFGSAAGAGIEGAGGLFSSAYGDALAGQGAFSGLAAGGTAGAGAEGVLAGGGAIAGGAGAIDPIQGLMMLDQLGNGAGAAAGAQSLGYSSVADALANSPAWELEQANGLLGGGATAGGMSEGAAGGAAAGAGGIPNLPTSGIGGGGDSGAGAAAGDTPDATMKGMFDKLGSGVNLQDMARLGLSNFGDIGNLFSKMAFSNAIGPTGGGFGLSPWSIGQGLYGLTQSNKLKKLAQQLGQQADPQAPFRAGYASKLNGLVNDPSTITSMPGYQAGLEAVERRMASQGFQGSGNMMAALQKYGGDFYNNQVSQFSQLAGGSAGAGGPIQMSGNIDATNLIGQSLNRLAWGFNR